MPALDHLCSQPLSVGQPAVHHALHQVAVLQALHQIALDQAVGWVALFFAARTQGARLLVALEEQVLQTAPQQTRSQPISQTCSICKL